MPPTNRAGFTRVRTGTPLDLNISGDTRMVVKIVVNDKGGPAGKLADVELHFSDGGLEGLKLLGFGVWERRNGSGRNVTFPARTYMTAGERRSYTLLRPLGDLQPQERLRELILAAYTEFEAQMAVTS
jgi:hypothetical protein